LAALCGALGLISFGARAQQAQIQVHIPQEPLSKALIDLALQAKLSVGYAGIDFGETIAGPLEGGFQPEEALRRLLAGSGYEPFILNSDTILIRRIAAAAEAPADQPDTELPPPIEEIVVTATKRAELAQSLPYSIVVISGGRLNDLGVHTANDLQMHVSALSATNLGPGQDKLSIRGLSDSAFAGRTQSVVGLYLDESRLSDDAPDPALRLVDIDRIEIVRGPQGTLYGAGTLGGLIRVITNKPVLNAEHGMISASAATTQHGAESGGIDAMLNVPLVENILGLRIVGYTREDGGYIDDARLHLRNANKIDTDGARLSLLWQPDDDWSVTAGFTGQTIDAAGSQYVMSGLGAFARANYEPDPNRDQFLQGSLTIEGALDWANLTSATAFTDRRMVDRQDATLAWQSLTGFPAGPSTFDTLRTFQTVTQETRLTSVHDDDWSWVVGTFLSHRNENYHSLLAGPGPARTFYTARAETRGDDADEAALFGEATYKLNDWFSLTAGTRLYYSAFDAAAMVGQSGPLPPAFAQGRNKATGFIPKVILSVQASDNLTFYADATEGFRLGGVNINSPVGAININRRARNLVVSANARTFDSDRLWTYELGAKTSFFDRTLIVNTDIYYTVWDNIQSDQILRDGSLYTANAGGAHVPGMDMDFDLKLTRQLRLEGNFFWSDPQIVHPNPLLIQFAGRLPGVPQNSFGVSGRYDIPLEDGWDAFVRLEYSYVGPSTLGFDARNSAAMGNYTIGNLRLGIDRDGWQGTLFVNNVTNQRANTFAFGNPFIPATITQSTPLRPRTIGVEVTASY
jgi:outer membrane receptor protein involved in Fe transport